MFDIGFSELMVIGLVALVVLGPERLPKVARTVGHLLGRVQRYVNDVKSDINREMQLDELRKLQSQVQEQARTVENSIRQGVGEVESNLNKAASEFEQSFQPAADAASAADPVPAAAEPVLPLEPAPPKRRAFVAKASAPCDGEGGQ